MLFCILWPLSQSFLTKPKTFRRYFRKNQIPNQLWLSAVIEWWFYEYLGLKFRFMQPISTSELLWYCPKMAFRSSSLTLQLCLILALFALSSQGSTLLSKYILAQVKLVASYPSNWYPHWGPLVLPYQGHTCCSLCFIFAFFSQISSHLIIFQSSLIVAMQYLLFPVLSFCRVTAQIFILSLSDVTINLETLSDDAIFSYVQHIL